VAVRNASLNRQRRTRELSELKGGEVVDVLVVGGGASGTGIALDAASRGLSVALIEKRDLAHGTSRWSSKLIHGGLRYLAKGDIGIAHESAVERGILMEKTAPHLIRSLPMLTPIGSGVRRRMVPLTLTGLWAGEALRVAAGTSSKLLPVPRIIPIEEARGLFGAIRTAGVRRSLLAYDGQLCDDARLVIAIARTAAAHGAKILTYCKATSVDGDGADVSDEEAGGTFRIRAKHVVNATGVWADSLAPEIKLGPSKGAHLIFRAERLGHPEAALLASVPGTISRFVFFLPQTDGRVYLGLTDDRVDEVEDEARASERDRRFLLETANRVLGVPLTERDIVGSYAGFRPLLAAEGADTADLSRHHQVLEGANGVLTIVGGKLTTYRKMAEDAVDEIADRAGVTAGPCQTRALPLVGAEQTSTPRRGDARAEHLHFRYGSEAAAITAMIDDAPALGEPVVEGLPYVRAELAWGIEHEGAMNASDLLDRRTRIGLVPEDRRAGLSAATEQLRSKDGP